MSYGRTEVDLSDEPSSGSTTSEGGQESGGEFLGRFADEEAAKAYIAELEGKANADAGSTEGESNDSGSESQGQDDAEGGSDAGEAADAASQAGLDLNELRQKVAESGELEDSDYEAFEKAGIDRSLVDEYIALKQQQLDSQSEKSMELVGGEDNYKQMLEWASENLSKEEIENFNTAVLDPHLSDTVILGLNARFTKANGGEGRRITGRTTKTDPASRPFESWAQLREAQRDPRYKSDPAYQKQVRERIRSSKLA